MTLMIDRAFRGVDPWLAYFAEVELPVLRHTAQQLDALRGSAEEVDIRKLVRIVLNDPMMMLRVFAHIEKTRDKRQVTDLKTIDRAIMMIGVAPFFAQFHDLPVIETQLKGHPKALLALLKVNARTRIAAKWAKDWATLRRDLDVEEIRIAALLHNFSEVLMWCFAPTLAIRVLEPQGAPAGLSLAEIQAREFGVPLAWIEQGLAQRWRLPALIGELVNKETVVTPKILNVKLAVDLARHSASGWHEVQVDADLSAVEDLLHTDRDNLLLRLGAPEDMVLSARRRAEPLLDGVMP